MRLRPLAFALCLAFGPAGLRAQAPCHVTGVVRKGLPPYEDADRTYLLDGGRNQGLRPGLWLRVKRKGDPRPLGWLQVTAAGTDSAEARLVREGVTYVLKGDEAWSQPLRQVPPTPPAEAATLAALPPPAAGAVAPPWEGLLFFLPGRDDLSPAGQRKLADWVEAWGLPGRWMLQVPAQKGAAATALAHRRAETLRKALAGLGVAQVEVDGQPRAASGPNDPVWVRHWEGPAASPAPVQAQGSRDASRRSVSPSTP